MALGEALGNDEHLVNTVEIEERIVEDDNSIAIFPEQSHKPWLVVSILPASLTRLVQQKHHAGARNILFVS